MIVGEVLGFDADSEGAQVTLGLYPDQVRTIPANVTGSIVPKTLFGEKYVALEVPADPAPDHIRAGATIDRTEVAIEVEKVLNDLYPLLRAVQPADINQTLNAHRHGARGPRRAASARTSRRSTPTSSGSTRRSRRSSTTSG